MLLFCVTILAILAVAAKGQVIGVYGPCEGPISSMWLSCSPKDVIQRKPIDLPLSTVSYYT